MRRQWGWRWRWAVVVCGLAAAVSASPVGATGAGDRCSVTRVADDLVPNGLGAGFAADLSADGSTLAWASVGALHLRDLATGRTTTVTVPGAGAVFSPVLSADGDRVAFVAGDYSLVLHGYVGQLDVFLHDRTSGETTRLIDDGMFNLLPTISADGRVVAASNYGTVIVADVAAGETTRHDVRNALWYETPVSLSPDGATIAFSPEPAAAVGSGVHLLDVSSGAVTPVPGLAAAYAPRYLADGEHLLVEETEYDGDHPEVRRLFRYDLAGGGVDDLGPTEGATVVVGDGTRRVDSSTVGVHGQNPEGNHELTSTVLATGATTQLTGTVANVAHPIATSATGDLIAFASRGPAEGRYRLSLATPCDPPPQPDAAIAPARTGVDVGDDVYAVAATHLQTLKDTIRPGTRRSFVLRLQNDRTMTDTITVAGRDAGRRDVRVRYRLAGADVTPEVEAGTFTTGPLVPGGSTVLRIEVTAGPGLPRDARHLVEVTARSATNRVAADTVRVKLTAPH